MYSRIRTPTDQPERLYARPAHPPSSSRTTRVTHSRSRQAPNHARNGLQIQGRLPTLEPTTRATLRVHGVGVGVPLASRIRGAFCSMVQSARPSCCSDARSRDQTARGDEQGDSQLQSFYNSWSGRLDYPVLRDKLSHWW